MGSHCQDLLPSAQRGKDKTTMPLLQCPGPAPDFATHAVVNGNIGQNDLKDYQGEKYVCIIFYPMDFVHGESITPFSNRVDEFGKLNCAVMAMSTDSVYSHKAFVKSSKADGGLEGKCKIPLLADRSGKICKKYGVFDAEEGVARKALVEIDDRGTARHMIASSLPTDKVIDDTLKVISQFQKKGSAGTGSADKQWKAMPAQTNGPFPNIQSKHSLVASHVSKDVWEKLKGIKTKTSGFTLIQAIACAVEFDNQHCGIYAGDWDSYKDFAPVFDPIIQEYHGISADAKHTSDMDVEKVKGNINSDVPVHSCRIRVGRSIDGFGLSPGITKDQRVGVEKLMINAVKSFPSDLAGNYYPLTGMDERVRQQLVDDHFLFVSGDRNLTVAGMERDWPEGRGIFHNTEKTFLIWINEEDQLRIISMQMGGNVKEVFERLAKGIKAVQDSVKKESGKDFCLDERFGYIHSCPSNLGTGMRASVHVDLPGWTKEGVDKLKARCEALAVQPRGTRGESGGQTGHTYDISNKHRLGYPEVELVQKMIDGVNKLWEEDKKLQKGEELYRAMPAQTNGPFPNIQSKHSLVAKHVTKDKWEKLKGIKTKTSGFTLIQAIACAVDFDNQHRGIYAGDWDSYKDFAPVFDPIIQEYHGISSNSKHTSDKDSTKIKGNIASDVPVHSARIRVGRSIDGFGLSPRITKEQRLGVENLMKNATATFTGDLAGQYYPLTGMDEKIRQQLADDHFLFVSGDRNLTVAGMERDWPEGRGIFHNAAKTFLIWINEEDQLRIISMQMGGDVKGVFSRLARGIK